MQLMLRPPSPRFHPLMRLGSQRNSPYRGLRGLGYGDSINPTTIWTPTYGFLAETGTLAGGYQNQPQVFSVYDVPGLLLPPPACALSDPYTAGSAECQQQLMATQQQNFQRTADYNAGRLELYKNAPTGPPPVPGTSTASGSGPGGGASGGAPQFSFTNLTRGDNSRLMVGDRWSIVITGAQPNAPVSLNWNHDGTNGGPANMGNTDASGRFETNGQMGQGEVGSWQEAWRVNNQIVASISFSVSPAGSVVTGSPAGAGSGTQTAKTQSAPLPGASILGTIQIGGTEVPWALIAGGVAVAFLVMRGK